MDEIVGLKQHIAELGVAEARVAAFEPASDRIFGQHHVDRKVLADVAQEFEVSEFFHPIEIVDQPRGVWPWVEVEEPAQLRLHAGDVGPQRLGRQQVAFLAFSAGVADHAGGAAHQGDGSMARPLKATQHHQRHQMADVQAVGRRVEANVDRPRPLHQKFRQIGVVGRLVDQPPPGKLGDDVSGEWRVESGEWRVTHHYEEILFFNELAKPLIRRATSVVDSIRSLLTWLSM